MQRIKVQRKDQVTIIHFDSLMNFFKQMFFQVFKVFKTNQNLKILCVFCIVQKNENQKLNCYVFFHALCKNNEP